ncbi:putative F-box protein [Platanthera zijinensis]|uniref:F-box protein n=1 Tax=Platanthera zijinensis TaxID=2320716 RepID=A0AAP0G3S0_9ASPA
MGLSFSKCWRSFLAQHSRGIRAPATMRRARDPQGESVIPSKRKGRAVEAQIQKPRKRGRSLSSCTSPRISFLAPHSEFSWYEEDLWIEVAKYLDGRDLVQLAVTNRWFCRLILEESVWKYACLRDLHVPSPHHVSFNWLQLYASAFDGSHSHCFRQKEKHIDWMRIGAFFFETPWAVLTEKLALPSKLTELSENHERDIQLSGTCILTDIRTGIWIADLQLVRCPVCNLHTCEGTMQILDVRHLELFLEEGFRNGSWEFDELGSHRIEKPSKSAAGGVFDYSHVYSSCTAGQTPCFIVCTVPDHARINARG